MAALGIFLTWLELMMIVGRFPTFGLYVQMFTMVAVNFSKFLLAYCCLLFAFGLSFAVLFANYPPFTNVPLSLLKTVVMMSGELEFEDMFYNGEPGEEIQFPYTAHFLFLMFVVLVTVILTNLLVGLAVSDIQGLQKSAGESERPRPAAPRPDVVPDVQTGDRTARQVGRAALARRARRPRCLLAGASPAGSPQLRESSSTTKSEAPLTWSQFCECA